MPENLKKKIVLAEDDPDISRLVRRLLEEEGHAVVEVHDGQAALDAYKKDKPDMLVLDVNMPIKDGFEVCEEVRRTDNEILILMLTGKRTTDNKAEGLGKGADGYVTKPFGSLELMARVRSLFRRI